MNSIISAIYFFSSIFQPTSTSTEQVEKIYTRSLEKYPRIDMREDDLELGFQHARNAARQFLNDEQLEEFSLRFKQELAYGKCFGESLFLSARDTVGVELTLDEKARIIYFQSFITTREILKEKKDKIDDLLPYYDFLMHLEKDIRSYFNEHGKNLSSSFSEPKIIKRADQTDAEFTENVLDQILLILDLSNVKDILFNVGYTNGIGHTILVRFHPPEIYDPMFGGYHYNSLKDLIQDLLKQTSPLLEVEKIWIDTIDEVAI